MSSTLERRYRRLLLAYPSGYRRDRGDEMIGTLLEAAPPEQRRPAWADMVDLLAGGVRHRLGLSTVPGLAAGLALAGPLALAVAAGICGYYLIAEISAVSALDAMGLDQDQARLLAVPAATIGPVVYLGWLLAALGRALLPRLASRWLVGAALAGTVAVLPVAPALHLTRPSLALLIPLLMLGLIALAGSRHAAGRAERIGVAVGPAVVTGALVGLTYWYMGPWYVDGQLSGRFEGYRSPAPLAAAYLTVSTQTVTAYVAGALILGLVLLGCVRGLRVPGDRRLLWAAAILMLAAGPLLSGLAQGIRGTLWNSNGLMPAGLAAGCALIGTLVWHARGRAEADHLGPGTEAADRGRGADRGLYLAGLVALGSAVGTAGFTWFVGGDYFPGPSPFMRLFTAGPDLGVRWVAFACWPLAALAAVLLRPWGARVAITAAFAVTLVVPSQLLFAFDAVPFPGGGFTLIGPALTGFAQVAPALIALGVVAVAGVPAAWPSGARRRLMVLAFAALAVIAVRVGSLLVAPPGMLDQSPSSIPLGGVAAAVIGVAAGWQALRAPFGARWLRGLVVFLASGGWLALRLPRYTSNWQLVVALGALLGVALLTATLRRRAGTTEVAGVTGTA